MIWKKPIHLLSLLLLIESIFSLQVNVTKVSPNVISPGQDIYLGICIVNDEGKDASVYFNIYTSSCLSSEINEINVNYISSRGSYCFPLKIKNYCLEGTYYLVINGSYISDSYKTFSYYYPIIIREIPYVYIENYSYSNNFYGEKSKVIVYLKTTNKIYDIFITFNYSSCSSDISSYYIKEINDTSKIEFLINIPANLNINYCIIPIIINYRDIFGNYYTSSLSLTIPIESIIPTLEIYTNTSRLNIGKNYFEIILYNPTDIDLDNIIISIENISNININRTYIDRIHRKSSYKIVGNLDLSYGAYKDISIPLKISFIANSKVYEIKKIITFSVDATPDIAISSYLSSQNSLVVNIYNNGSSIANNIQIDLVCYDCSLYPNKGFIGSLDIGSSDSIVANILSAEENSTLYIRVYYEDLYGNKYVKEEKFRFGDIGYKKVIKVEDNNYKYLIILLIIAVVLYVVYRRRKRENEIE